MKRFSSFLFLGLSDVFSRGVNWLIIFTIPLLINEEEFGRVAIMYISIQLFGAIFSFGLNKAILRYFHNQSNKRDYLRTLFFSWASVKYYLMLLFSRKGTNYELYCLGIVEHASYSHQVYRFLYNRQ